MPIKSFRGKMVDSTIDTIPLSTKNGAIGYRIVKFQVMPVGDDQTESTMKIYSVPQITATNDIDFSDNTLLGAGYITAHVTGNDYPEDQTIVFDNTIFNQDIYITLKGHSYTASLNYYIELEQIKLDLNENTVATLKDIRNIEAQ